MLILSLSLSRIQQDKNSHCFFFAVRVNSNKEKSRQASDLWCVSMLWCVFVVVTSVSRRTE
jgi:hypothetical protein